MTETRGSPMPSTRSAVPSSEPSSMTRMCTSGAGEARRALTLATMTSASLRQGMRMTILGLASCVEPSVVSAALRTALLRAARLRGAERESTRRTSP